jgi:uncharacterized protein HemY
MSLPTPNDRPGEAVSHLLSLGLTQLSIQVTLSTSLTAIALAWFALSMFLIGVLNLASATLHWSCGERNTMSRRYAKL